VGLRLLEGQNPDNGRDVQYRSKTAKKKVRTVLHFSRGEGRGGIALRRDKSRKRGQKGLIEMRKGLTGELGAIVGAHRGGPAKEGSKRRW